MLFPAEIIMHPIRRRGWEIPESAATPEKAFFDRRKFLVAAGLGAIGASVSAPSFATAGVLDSILDRPSEAPEADPSASLYPVERNAKFELDRPLTEERWATSYNNFYELSSGKRLRREAQRLKLRPWTVRVDGLVEKPFEIDVDALLAKMPLEERLYRHRCVETWAMAVPWSGFPLKALVDLARPLSSAKFLRLETFLDTEQAPRQGLRSYPWPYVEGLTIAEATNDLAFLATGVYGKPLPKQNGAPLRLAVPWKYGFKSAKSLVRFSFVEERPVSFWERMQASEYGFWANVNPDVPHPRWSQAMETMLGTGDEHPTQLFNGYGAFVAHLYDDLQGERLYV